MTTRIALLSYAQPDLQYKVVSRLRHDLERLPDLKVWVDSGRLMPGRNRSPLSRGGREPHFFIPVLSDAYHASGWAAFDVAWALRRQSTKRRLLIVPVRIDESETPDTLHGVHVIELADPRNYEAALSRLAQVLAYAPDELLGHFDVEKPTGDARTIISVSDTVSRALIARLATRPEELRTFNRRLFEELVAELFSGFGYEVELTKRTRDGGRDVIAVRHREALVKYLIECKRPDPGHKVGIRPVRELFGVKSDEGATKAILATTAEFTPDALVFFGRHRWELEPRDHAGLLEWLKQYLGTPETRGTAV